MRRTTSPRIAARPLTFGAGMLLALLLGPAAAAAPAEGEAARTRVQPDYRRERAEGDREARPASPSLPEELKRAPSAESGAGAQGEDEAPDVEASTAIPGREAASTRPPADPDHVRAMALRAAREEALRVARGPGRIAYYRIGAWEGLRAGIDDPRVGIRDFREGLRRGSRDPVARDAGTDTGVVSATEIAAEAAAARVAGQFRDLSREPRFDPLPDRRAYRAPEVWVDPPQLADVFRDFPVSRRVAPRLADAFDEWRLDAWGLYRCGSYREFHEPRWSDPGRALAHWKRDRRNAAEYRALDPAGRKSFDELFRAEFRLRLDVLFEREILHAYDHGFEDGWDYGGFVREEWQYRLGYAEGFDGAAAAAAAAAFRTAYPAEFEREYSRSFREWQDSPRPEILGLSLIDGNDDGVFEPGEDLLVSYEVANYGGRGATLPLRLDGRVLDGPAQLELRLPARAALREPEPLRARIDPATPARTAGRVRLSLAGNERAADLPVSYPLEIDGPPVLAGVDTLAGRATARVRVVNRSRRPVEGFVDARADRAGVLVEPVPTGRLDAGRSALAELALDGLRPLDLLAGGVRVDFGVERDGRLHDRAELRLPALARDLGRRDLLDYMLRLAREERPARADVAQVRGLLLERLRVDWRAAVQGRGNPYREDLKRGTANTALGELALAWRAERGRLRSPEVFAGLREDVLGLARELPGAHPFLRKSMRKLARRLG